jgi:hypothetical protein
MGVEWIIVPMLVVACIKALVSVVVDAYIAIVHPDREAPSLARRRARIEIAQQQHELTGATGVGQAVADRLATRIANPPPGPAWWTRVGSYLATLFADFFSQERRRRKPAAAHCWICDDGHDGSKSGLCPKCEVLTPTPCAGCGLHLLEADLEDGKCEACRPVPASPPPPPSPPPTPRPRPAAASDGPARMSVPAWLAEPDSTGRKS